MTVVLRRQPYWRHRQKQGGGHVNTDNWTVLSTVLGATKIAGKPPEARKSQGSVPLHRFSRERGPEDLSRAMWQCISVWRHLVHGVLSSQPLETNTDIYDQNLCPAHQWDRKPSAWGEKQGGFLRGFSPVQLGVGFPKQGAQPGETYPQSPAPPQHLCPFKCLQFSQPLPKGWLVWAPSPVGATSLWSQPRKGSVLPQHSWR